MKMIPKINNNVTTVTSYLANLTTRLSKLSSLQQQEKHRLEQELLTVGEDSFLEENINQSYRKKNNENYLEYFQRILKNPLTYRVRLKSINESFSLCEDLLILTSVSASNKANNKVIQKVLEEMIKYGNVYEKNARNQLIKRPLKKIVERYNFLKQNIEEEEIKYIVKWISKNGLERDVACIEVMDIHKINENKSSCQLNIKITAKETTDEKNRRIAQSSKTEYLSNANVNEKSIMKRVNPITASIAETIANENEKSNLKNESWEEEDEYNIAGRKKRKQSVEKNKSKDHNKNNAEKSIDNIFQTPTQTKMKIDLEEPKAPKKEYKNQYNYNDEKTTKPNTIINNDENSTKQRRKFTRIIDAKKDVIIKEDHNNKLVLIRDNNEKEDEEKKLNNINIDTIKLNRTMLKVNQEIKIETPRISEFVLYPYVMEERNEEKKEEKDEEKQTINDETINNEDRQKKEQEEVQLEQILKEFEQKTNHSKVKILKLLDEMSGDLTDLREYLEKENKILLWKRLEDAVLRRYVREKLRGEDNNKKAGNSHKLKIELMYNELLATKGPERVSKRITYLNLAPKSKHINKHPS